MPGLVYEEAFFVFLRLWLWKECIEINGRFTAIDFDKVLYLAAKQSVIGIVASGVERVTAQEHLYIVPLTEKLKFTGKAMLIEQRNVVMNKFVGELFGRLQNNGINAVLLKGQGWHSVMSVL